MSQETESKNKKISGIITTVICTLLFLLFWFYNFNFELPPVIEAGAVAVNLGEPDAGGPQEVPVEAESKPSVPTIPSQEAYEQTPDEDAVATKKTTEAKKKQDKPVDKPEEIDELLKSLQKGKQNQTQSNAGDGNKSGAQGDPTGKTGGDPHGGAGTPGAGGPGVSTTFKGRSFNLGDGKNTCNQEGKVILDVILMPDGTIKFDGVNPGSTGSTCLENVAKNYLRNSNFNASSTAGVVDGTITFVFKLR